MFPLFLSFLFVVVLSNNILHVIMMFLGSPKGGALLDPRNFEMRSAKRHLIFEFPNLREASAQNLTFDIERIKLDIPLYMKHNHFIFRSWGPTHFFQNKLAEFGVHIS